MANFEVIWAQIEHIFETIKMDKNRLIFLKDADLKIPKFGII